MWELPRPGHTVSDVLSLCVSLEFRRDPTLRDRLWRARPEMEIASSFLESAIAAGNTHSLDRQGFALTEVSNAEMSKIYNERLVRAKAPARHVYEEILAAPNHGVCPFCGQRDVSTLDHYMPKAVFSALAIDPINLIPACRDCNFIKGVQVSSDPSTEPLHPYFDQIGQHQWLKARILHTQPAVVQFFVDASPTWDEQLASRVRANFQRFKLARLYTSHAAQELNSIRLYLEDLYQVGAAEIATHLAQMAKARREARLNSWQTAMYQALAIDDWFHDGNFRVPT